LTIGRLSLKKQSLNTSGAAKVGFMADKASGTAGTAIVLLETINEFMHPGGAFHAGIQAVARRNGCLTNLVELARRARGRVPLVYAPIHFQPGHADIKDREGILAKVCERRALLRDSFGARFFPEIEPQSGDLVLDGQRGISAFHGTDLDRLLRERGIRHVAVGGFLTNVCVESTVRSAYDFGYRVTVVSDATACNSPEEQAFAETRILPYFARVLTTENFLAEL
jgi:nicotinamidase-related amidase